MAENIEEIDVPPLKSSGGMSSKLRIMAVAVVVLLIFCLLGVYTWNWVKQKRAEEASDSPQAAGEVKSENRDTDVKAPPAFVAQAMADRAAGRSPDAADSASTDSPGGVGQVDSGGALPPPPAAGGRSAAGDGQSDAEKAEADHQARRQHAPVLAFSRTAPSLANGMGQKQEAPAEEADPYQEMMAAALSASTRGDKPDAQATQPPLNQQLKSEARVPSVATRQTNRSFMVRQATMGRCTMRTAFNSQLSGFASCLLSDPLYSADGRFIMAEAGSEVIGEYQTGQVKPGVSRAFVLWTSIETPHGVRIGLDSPATDGMGQSGITGRVNNHFWKRFGSGLLLSVVDDAIAQTADNTTNYRSTSQSMNEAAAIAVQSNVDIPPTIKVKAGAVVNIFVARDLDFSSVYSMRLADGAPGR
ncbi:TrbI/VirB10 family protein [Stenotrophomonas maltophilia]